MEKFLLEFLAPLKAFVIKKWRRPEALIIVFLLIIYLFFFETKKYVKGFDPNAAYLPLLVLVLLIVFGIWFYMRFKYKLATNKIKFGIIVNHENRSASEIERIIKPIISDLSYQIKDVVFIELDSSLFYTEEAANDFLKNNDYGLKQLLHIKADIGKVDNVEKFIIESASFMVYDMPVGFMVYDVFVDLREEAALRNPKQWSFSMANEVEGTKATRLELKDMLYYYLGLSAVCNSKPELGLAILKRLFKPHEYFNQENNNSVEEDEEEEKRRLERNRKFFLASRLVKILSRLCQLVFQDYHNSGRDPKQTIVFLEEYALLLAGSKEAIYTYIPLARYNYDLGNIDKARMYTDKAFVTNNSSVSALLNKGFFAAVDGDTTKLAQYYKSIINQTENLIKAGSQGRLYNAIEILSFFAEHADKYPARKIIFDYIVAFHTILSVDSKEGIKLMNKFLNSINGDIKYKALDLQAKYLVKHAPSLAFTSTKAKPKPKGPNSLPKAA